MANDWTVQDNDNFVNIKSGQTLNIDLPIKTENATNDLELFLNTHRTGSSTIYVDMDNTIAGFNIKLAPLEEYFRTFSKGTSSCLLSFFKRFTILWNVFPELRRVPSKSNKTALFFSCMNYVINR